MRSLSKRAWALAAAAVLGGTGGITAAVLSAGPAAAVDYCNGKAVTIAVNLSGSWYGSPGSDVAMITANGASYTPNGGNDTICIRATNGSTIWYSASGSIWVDASAASDTIYGTDGPDVIYANGGNDLVKGNGGNDTIYGYGGNDYLWAMAGDDHLLGGSGSDCLLGGRGDDWLQGEDGNDSLVLGANYRYTTSQCIPPDSDTSAAANNWRAAINSDSGGVAQGHNGNDLIWGSHGDNYLNGTAGDDILVGLAGSDSIDGGDGTDTLRGGDGRDFLDGQQGWYDQLYGEGGADDILVGDATDTCYPDFGPEGDVCSDL